MRFLVSHDKNKYKRKHEKHEEKKGKNKPKIFNNARPIFFSSLLSLGQDLFSLSKTV
jgi:hypothetical protein